MTRRRTDAAVHAPLSARLSEASCHLVGAASLEAVDGRTDGRMDGRGGIVAELRTDRAIRAKRGGKGKRRSLLC